MNAKKYFAQTAREALRRVKEELGPDAIVLSNRSVDGGVEITAVMSSEIDGMQAAASAPRSAPTTDIDDDFTVSLSAGARKPAPARPVPEAKSGVREWPPGKAAARESREADGRRSEAPPERDNLLRELAAIKGLIEQ
ncbi:MAG: flagellar biosynthesis protein FlhF, partial [Rhodocyclaceae bacterium]|nr:flagellar biosynthesis protein FlhF [Rhodocyclaceae bacterium]